MTRFSQYPKFPPGTMCEVCNQNLAIDLDHALFSGSQRNKKRQTVEWRRFLDSEYNVRPACALCNRFSRRANRHDSRFTHVHNMLKRGPVGFKKWFQSAPESLKRGERWLEVEIIILAIEQEKAK